MISLDQDPIDQIAKENFGIDYLFPFQRLVVSNILEKRDQIVILPTGAGKSLCFSLPALLLEGPTLIIFPLLALMSDQARRLEETGHGVAIVRGGQGKSEREKIWREIETGKITYILSNPETLIQEKTAARLKNLSISHMVIDEAHTVSEWGDSFRPSYLKLAEIRHLAEIPQVSAFTATASEHVLKRIREIIFEDSNPHLVQSVPDRPNISYSVHPALSKDREIRAQVETAERPAIIFCRSRTATELTARMLRRAFSDERIRFYHAGLSREEKKSVEEWFFESNDGILAATCAYGMGVDKSNIRTVLHRDVPPSVEAYLQESGRAGRDRGPAEAILLSGPQDWRGLLNGNDGKKSKPQDTLARQRYLAMLRYASSGATCRRRYLLALLSAEPDICFGCDVCRGDLDTTPPGMGEIIKFASLYPRTFEVSDASRILAGWMSRDVVNRRLYAIGGYGSLSGWFPSDIEEAITSLIGIGLLEMPRRGPWKRKIRLSSRRKYGQRLEQRKDLLGTFTI